MAGLFAISVDPKIAAENFLEDLFWGTFYQQHWGEEYTGLAIFANGRQEQIAVRTHRGLFRPTFGNDMVGLEGTAGIGYCGSAREPYLIRSRLGELCLCFSGNLVNRKELIGEFMNAGQVFARGDDIEVISKLLVQGDNVIEGIRNVDKKIKGAYSLLILSREGIYAARCPAGYWPLVVGHKDGAVAVASGSTGFDNLGFEPERDIAPGEIVLLQGGSFWSKDLRPAEIIQECSFCWFYTDFATSVLNGISVSAVRKRSGAALARRDIEAGFIPDIVSPIPDSGKHHALGYHQEFCRQITQGKVTRVPLYDELLSKYPYAGRSFTPIRSEDRQLEGKIKQLPSGESYQGKKAAIIDDSIVRGTQTCQDLVPKLRATGVTEIHLRISNPPLLSPCPWGKTTNRKNELFAFRFPEIKKRVEFLKVESLMYNTTDDIAAAIGLPSEQLCIDCSLSKPLA